MGRLRRSLATPAKRPYRLCRYGRLIRLSPRGGLAAVLALAALLLSGSASAKPPWVKDLASIDRGIDRAVVRAGGLAWEYYFRFGGGRPPWISGMAQAVAAQALSRAGTFLADPTLTAASQRVYKTIPLLTRSAQTGPWIRLYAFNNVTVLNAQLQTILSLQDYATQTGDQAAVKLASRLQAAAVGLLPRFATGYWSLYSLGGGEAPLEYHKYVV